MAIELARNIMGLTPTSATLHAVVTRADGKIEDLGIIARTDEPCPSIVQRFADNFRKAFK